MTTSSGSNKSSAEKKAVNILCPPKGAPDNSRVLHIRGFFYKRSAGTIKLFKHHNSNTLVKHLHDMEAKCVMVPQYVCVQM